MPFRSVQYSVFSFQRSAAAHGADLLVDVPVAVDGVLLDAAGSHPAEDRVVDLPLMAAAFRQAIEAGRKAYLAGLGRVLTRGASASDPLTGFLRD